MPFNVIFISRCPFVLKYKNASVCELCTALHSHACPIEPAEFLMQFISLSTNRNTSSSSSSLSGANPPQVTCRLIDTAFYGGWLSLRRNKHYFYSILFLNPAKDLTMFSTLLICWTTLLKCTNNKPVQSLTSIKFSDSIYWYITRELIAKNYRCEQLTSSVPSVWFLTSGPIDLKSEKTFPAQPLQICRMNKHI